ncbi:malate dehydrogenase (quinone) [Paracoccus benzoatiresistens]|uniref:Probable malate:quinone oxidoreductase n=1 Tax=Paracoccus benzoatiresistens TaxID=2997341 RepID=A0ABT4J6G3_9RHOB|nr:malate dehydrogenase (quinone) [Paracoccus sp. EF6]MCZ0962668.1 malate dehydrogenase (quinone) [Paracoccus sp. EF6]
MRAPYEFKSKETARSEGATRGRVNLTRRQLLGTTIAAAALSALPVTGARAQAADATVDVLLIGGGIMSATLGILLHELEPEWTIRMVERLDAVAEESSNGWNNAGTGHSALCELNYTPEDKDGNVQITKAIEINEQFQITRQFLSHQIGAGVLTEPRRFINSTPHMNLVWGDENVEYLRKRYEALKASPLFAGMEFTTDPAQIAEWVPLMMAGRDPEQVLAATRSNLGTDVNFGEITRQYVAYLETREQFTLETGHEVRAIFRNEDGTWRVTSESMADGTETVVNARFVFLGGGGGALPLLQMSGIPEGDDYAGFPVGGSFLVTENPEVVRQHLAKVYGKASVGSPPMSVPHLDTRILDGKQVLLFGPFATFSTKFLKNGSLWDLPASVTLDNIWPMLNVGWDEFDLVKYLAGQLMQSHEDQMAALREYYPEARDEDWRLWQAGQRVQIIKRDPEEGGVLKLGTEVVSGAEGSLAALLGASPGASTAAPIMLHLLERVFPQRLQTPEWQSKLRQIVPSYGVKLNDDPAMLAQVWATAEAALELALPAPRLNAAAELPQPGQPAPGGEVIRVPDMAL